MRRSKREMVDPQKIDAVIAKCHCCRLGLCDGDAAYIVPMNFGYTVRDRQRSFYFHSAKEGRKIELLRRNPAAGFELDTGYQLYGKETACSYSAYFQSVIGRGVVTFVTEPAEKREGLRLLMLQNTGKPDWVIPDMSLDEVCVLRLDVTEMTCKSHLPKEHCSIN